MLQKKYKAEVIRIINHGEGVYTLELKSSGRKFKYTPGQFLHIALDEYDPSMGWPESRCFSMQTPPGIDTVKITYAVKGKFTAQMANELKEGNEVQIKMPYGNLFDQEHIKQNTVFIAGGTGVTPYLSLFNDERFAEYENPVLYIGLRSNKYNLYIKELDTAKNINRGFTANVIYQDKKGMLNIESILKASDKDTSFFISGPPQMIKNFKNYLVANKVAENNVLTDDWE